MPVQINPTNWGATKDQINFMIEGKYPGWEVFKVLVLGLSIALAIIYRMLLLIVSQ
jgi:hypothetical protein